MSAGPARRFDALLDECLDVLGRIGARVAGRLGDPTGDVGWGDVGDAARLLRALEDAAAVARAEEGGLPAVASDACPACGGNELGVVGAIPGVALGRVEAGAFVPADQTELDWSGWRPSRAAGGTVLACTACGARWVHPSLVLNEH